MGIKANLCDLCKHDFATCSAGKIVFGIDRDPSVRGEEADRVIECENFYEEGEEYKQGENQ